MTLFKILLNLMINRANKQRWQVEIGTHLLKKGVGYKIGDPVTYRVGKKDKTYYIANLHYDFANNRVNHTVTLKKPIVEDKG